MDEQSTFTPGCDIVAAVTDTIKVELRALVSQSSGVFTIDLNGVDMIDSKGIGLLIATNNSLTGQGRQLRIIHASPDLIDLFRVMRLDRHFLIEQ